LDQNMLHCHSEPERSELYV